MHLRVAREEATSVRGRGAQGKKNSQVLGRNGARRDCMEGVMEAAMRRRVRE